VKNFIHIGRFSEHEYLHWFLLKKGSWERFKYVTAAEREESLKFCQYTSAAVLQWRVF